MKKIVIILLILLFAGYILLMTAFEEPICIDNVDFVSINVSDRSISLPWYLRICTRFDIAIENGNFTRFVYLLPDIFEDSEMDILVEWTTPSATVYIGETRAIP